MKKLFSLALALVMTFALVAPVIAVGEAAAPAPIFSEDVCLAGAANTLSDAVSLAAAVAETPSNDQVVTGPDTRIWKDGFGFHCNALKGNGQTSVEYMGDDAAIKTAISKLKKQPAGSMVVEKGEQKNIFGTSVYPIELVRVGETTRWDLITDEDIKCSTCGRYDWVTYSNNSGVINGKNIQAHHPYIPPPPEYNGELKIDKTVDGKIFGDWVFDGDIDVLDLISGISFKFFLADADGGIFDEDAPIGNGYLDPYGVITFDELPDGLVGWIAVVEYFVPGSLAEALFDDVGPQYFYIVGQDINGNYIIDSGDGGFDFDALYELKVTGQFHVLGDPQLNANGNVQNIYVKDVDGDDWLASYCANAGSVGFGSLYKADNSLADAEALAKAEAALNYIFNKYGSVDSNGGWGYAYGINDNWTAYNTAIELYNEGDDSMYVEIMGGQSRLLSQIAIWAFFNGVDLNIAWYSTAGGGGIPDQYKIAIDDVLDNALSGKGNLKLAYLVDAERGLDVIRTSQPQLVPYFGRGGFDNKTKGGYDSTVSFNKTLYGGEFPDLLGLFDIREFGFDLFKIVDGNEEYIETFYPDPFGTVTVDILSDGSYLLPGNYVFREVLGNLGIVSPDGSFGYPWLPIYPGSTVAEADGGLFFSIDANGDAVWPTNYDLDEEGNPTVNNVIVEKWLIWVPEIGVPAVYIDLGEGNGFLMFTEGEGRMPGTYFLANYIPASCTRDAELYFEGPMGNTFMFSLSGTKLGHDWLEIDIWEVVGHDENGGNIWGIVGTKDQCQRCGLLSELNRNDTPWCGHDDYLCDVCAAALALPPAPTDDGEGEDDSEDFE